MINNELKVQFFTNGVGIYDESKELHFWSKENWADEPIKVYEIVNMVRLAYTDPQRLRRELGV